LLQKLVENKQNGGGIWVTSLPSLRGFVSHFSEFVLESDFPDSNLSANRPFFPSKFCKSGDLNLGVQSP
jgi:hypothetical protein